MVEQKYNDKNQRLRWSRVDHILYASIQALAVRVEAVNQQLLGQMADLTTALAANDNVDAELTAHLEALASNFAAVSDNNSASFLELKSALDAITVHISQSIHDFDISEFDTTDSSVSYNTVRFSIGDGTVKTGNAPAINEA
jgi:hypothetical protein